MNLGGFEFFKEVGIYAGGYDTACGGEECKC